MLHHLARCRDCQMALLQAAGPLHLPTAAPSGEEPPAELLVRLRQLAQDALREQSFPEIPGFELLDILGQGGSATVYRARHLELGRLVAMKILSLDYVAQPQGQARYRRGVEILAAMEHPNIIRVLHAGTHEGLSFVVQEFAEGGSLANLLHRGATLRPDEAARLVKLITDAVAALHAQGFLHRDIKPANILLVTRADRSGTSTPQNDSGLTIRSQGNQRFIPKLGDFGLVRAIDDRDELTSEGLVVGTPGAMAPEQAEGTSRLGPAIDIWSLGVVLYELLTGRPPFEAATTTELLGQTSRDFPDPPSILNPEVPAELEQICLTCLRKDPRDRYLTAASLSADLAAFLDRPFGPSRSTHVLLTVSRPLWKHRTLITWLIGGGLLLFSLWGWWHAETRRELAAETLHQLRLDMARDYLEDGERAKAWMLLERCDVDKRDAEWKYLWEQSQLRN